MQRSREEAERNEQRGNNEKITLKLERSKRNVHNFEHLSPREARQTVDKQSRKSALNAEGTPRKYPIPRKLELPGVHVPLASLHTLCISFL